MALSPHRPVAPSPSPRHRIAQSPRLFLIAVLILCAASLLEAQTAELDARGAATAAMRGPRSEFLRALDLDEPLERRVGTTVWRDLTGPQRDLLRSAARERFLGMLAPGSTSASAVAWSEAFPPSSDGTVNVLIGLNLSEKTLKTRWNMRRYASGWRIRDVVLSDPGISLAQATIESLGQRPLASRRSPRQARAEVLPSFSVLFVIALIVALAAPRLAAPRRKFLFLAASAPALVFLIAGLLAAVRVIRQPCVLAAPAAGEPWRRSEDLALEAEREGRFEEARVLWEHALAAGAPAGPVAYERGLAARQRGDAGAARAHLETALAAAPPAPGAARELAALASKEGRLAEADRYIRSYLTDAGPDPEALSLLAVIETDLGKSAEAVAAIAEARRLAGGGSRGAELEAQVRARAGDAGGAVAALRPLAREGRVDRSALRADPAYLPIATDPAWVSFINEKSR
jgi:tetratricopeptide (TPR) repeat protein